MAKIKSNLTGVVVAHNKTRSYILKPGDNVPRGVKVSDGLLEPEGTPGEIPETESVEENSAVLDESNDDTTAESQEEAPEEEPQPKQGTSRARKSK